jgi:hypothetical protein
VTLLKLSDILSLRPFLALHYFKFHFLSFFERAKALSRDVAVVHKDIGAIFLRNETVAFGIAEPLNFALDAHTLTSKNYPQPGESFAGKKKGTDRKR